MSVRINLDLPKASGATLDRLCEERSLSRAALLRQALGVMQVFHDATREGRYVGTTKDREALDTVIVAPL
jgi:Ribbon-helix-helix protein, copG family